jgi:tRNA dimethylallyltransferase
VSLPENLHNQIVVIAGPTAVGKSALALAVAQGIGGEIVSVDSMQVYRGMDIGTAKPTATQRALVPHHLLDVAEVNQPFSAAEFSDFASSAVRDILGRGKVPILCGGTGLYFRALLEGLDESPAADMQLRAELEAKPLVELQSELTARDPEASRYVDVRNPRRVIRALEILRLTGEPLSVRRSERPARDESAENLKPHWLGLARPAEDLRRRIDERVDEMFREGLVEETRGLLERGLAENRIALQALGYRQVVEHLQGARSLDETIRLVKSRTRQFSKRQMTWFRYQMHLSWHELGPTTDWETLAEETVQLARAAQKT